MVSLIEYTADPYWAGSVDMDLPVLVASATDIPVKPPTAWFNDPGLTELTPLTVKPNGQVYGHIAAWSGSHIGRLGKVRPPRSQSGYQYFRHGVVETDDGHEVSVGQITLVGGHAPLDAGVQAAVAHYDDTRSAVMDVAIGEDRKGIWVAGALRPGVNDVQIRTLKASGVSGDWRPIDNRLELVAICAVNVPGFPIPRALAASGLVDGQEQDDPDSGVESVAIYALVAAGVEPLMTLAHKDQTVSALEYALIDIETKMDWMRASLAVLASAATYDEIDPGTDTDPVVEAAATAVEALARVEQAERVEQVDETAPVSDEASEESSDAKAEVEVETEPEPEPRPEPQSEPEPDAPEQLEFAFTASLDGETLAREILAASEAHLLWDDGLPIHFTQPQCEAVALRMKFRKAVSVDPSKRAAALVAGAAMPDGRLPIFTDEDLGQALLIVPGGTEHYAHLMRRAAALGLDIDALREVALTAAAGEKYDFKQRLKMAKAGTALKDGSYPIADKEDLQNAIQSYGRAKDKAKAKAHIMKRARALRLVDLLPDKWED